MLPLKLCLELNLMYMHCSHLVSSCHAGMTDAERDAIDNEAQQYIKVCTDAIRQLKDDGLCHITALYTSWYSPLCLLL